MKDKNDCKYWIKMKLLSNKVDNWVMRCEHIGQVKLVSYILTTFNHTDHTWTYDKHKEKAIMQLIGLSQTSIFNYLKGLVKAEILIKKGRGIYEINREFLEFGSK